TIGIKGPQNTGAFEFFFQDREFPTLLKNHNDSWHPILNAFNPTGCCLGGGRSGRGFKWVQIRIVVGSKLIKIDSSSRSNCEFAGARKRGIPLLLLYRP
ncbi:hypothetical protein AVEN_246652-1, partial [Araneus ventricosus]